VTINGSGFTQYAVVRFANNKATNLSFTTSSKITVTSPAGTGVVGLTVTLPNGTQGSIKSAYTYSLPPSVTGVSPNSGSLSGGNSVTITGQNFRAGAKVSFGGTASTNVVFTNGSTLSATVPGRANAGSVAVTETNPDGQTASLNNGYSYVSSNPPTITSLNPVRGTAAGGTSVTIAGTNFLSGATVTFGGVAAAQVTVSSSTQIVAVTPADGNSSGGPVPVVVTNPGGMNATNSFDYVGSQAVTSVNPTTGPAAGGIAVDVYGSGFVPTTQILFGATNSASVTLINSTHINCTLPSGTGTVNVSAFTPGAGTGSLPNAFTYVEPLAITSVSPNIGPAVGGNQVTINGTGFVSGATVSFGSASAVPATFTNSTTLTAVPAGAKAGVDPVTVTNPDNSTTTLQNAYTFTNGPSVWTITPNSGSELGGQTITLSGANLSTVSQVLFGSAAATILTTAPGNVTVKLPRSSTAHMVSVTVKNPQGTQVLQNAFTYVSLAVNTQRLDDGYPGIPYSVTLTTNNAGLPPYRWAVVTGHLPPGLGLNANSGLLSGNPAGPPNATPYSFTVRVTDSASPAHTYDRPFSMNILYGFNTANIPSTYFGMTLNDPNDWPQPAPQGVGLQVGALAKGLSVSWPFIEQTKGVYDWSTLDTYVSQAGAHGVDMFYTNFDFPPWAVPNPTDPNNCGTYASGVVACVNMVSNISDWQIWNAALVTRYAGRIHMYELYNEPNTAGSFSGTVAQMVQLTNTFHDIIRKNDPAALIGAPSSSNSGYTQNYYQAGGTLDVDTINLHEYPNVTVSDFPEFVLTKIVQTQQVMIKNGHLSELPLWDTETGWGNNAYALSDPQQRAAFVARYLFLQWSVGIQRAYWYAWDEPNWGTLYDEGLGITLPAGVAYQQVQSWMLGAHMNKPCSANGGGQYTGTYTCTLFRSGGYQAQAVWNASLTCNNGTCPTSNYTPNPIYVQYRDIAGNVHPITSGQTVPISAQPILLEN
jgi:hypothetical protein